MNVEKNLFPYDLAIVSMMKNAAPYVKEWLDYHLAAGVEHFFIYDNDSEDNFKEVLQPYIDAGIVTYIFYPGKRVMMSAFNEAIDKYKYLCRYMAFVDDDEFILPKSNSSISEVVDEIFSNFENAGGLEIQWVFYGSSGHRSADCNHGVLERFTSRDAQASLSVKSLVNPRRVSHMWTPHFAVYFDNFLGVNQDNLDTTPNVNFKMVDKIVMNHYHTKSLEEFVRRKNFTDANFGDSWKNIEQKFIEADKGRNEVFDDGILKYRAVRQISYSRKFIDFDKIFNALTYNLLPINFDDDMKNFLSSPKNQLEYFRAVNNFYINTSADFFQGRLENFLTCWGVSNFLKGKFLDEDLSRNFEKISLSAVVKTLQSGTCLADLQFLMKEMPKFLELPYSVVDTIRKICIGMIREWQQTLQRNITSGDRLPLWEEILRWDYHLKTLKTFENYSHK